MTDRIRVLVTKVGFDGHDRGSRVVAGFLRDVGMEVIYTSPWQSLDAVCTIAAEEDVDVMGISTLATDHLLIPQLMKKLQDADLENVGVVVGGIVPDEEQQALIEAGVHSILGPGASKEDIVAAVTRAASAHREERSTL